MIDDVFKKLARIFKAKQFTVRTPGGAEASWEKQVRRTIDACGCMSRQCALEAVGTHCP